MPSKNIRYLFVPKIFSDSNKSFIYSSVGMDSIILTNTQLETIAKTLFPEADLVEILLTKQNNSKKEAKVIHIVKLSS